jgi:hypothetical protein
MASPEEQEVLDKELAALDDETARLADRFQQLAGMDCDFGECVFDPTMDSVQARIAEVQRRKKILEGMIEHLESCEK